MAPSFAATTVECTVREETSGAIESTQKYSVDAWFKKISQDASRLSAGLGELRNVHDRSVRCLKLGILREAQKNFADQMSGYYQSDIGVYVNKTLVQAYGYCGIVAVAEDVEELVPERDNAKFVKKIRQAELLLSQFWIQVAPLGPRPAGPLP